jgi:hypothetical protein
MRWAKHVARMKEKTNAYKGLVGKLKRYCSEDLEVDGKTKNDKIKIKRP